jgi:hypothetical protein
MRTDVESPIHPRIGLPMVSWTSHQSVSSSPLPVMSQLVEAPGFHNRLKRRVVSLKLLNDRQPLLLHWVPLSPPATEPFAPARSLRDLTPIMPIQLKAIDPFQDPDGVPQETAEIDSAYSRPQQVRRRRISNSERLRTKIWRSNGSF